MNNKILSAKKTISLFLALILVTGTIALSSTSSMRDVQAQQGYDGTYNNYENDYGKDNSYKSKDNKIVKKVKCNNINVNVNGLELNGLPPFLYNLLASDGQDGYGDASSYGSGSYGNVGQLGYDNNSFKFVCINNNNNTVIEEEPISSVPPTPPEPLTCEECFEEFLSPDEIDLFGELFGSAIDRFCILFTNPEFEIVVPEDAFRMALPGVDSEDIDNLIDCLEEKGVIFIQDLPPI